MQDFVHQPYDPESIEPKTPNPKLYRRALSNTYELGVSGIGCGAWPANPSKALQGVLPGSCVPATVTIGFTGLGFGIRLAV